jgi:sugar-specific transcriptional regulator TrmB
MPKQNRDSVESVDLELQARRLQNLGLNAYESRAYLVLIGHPRFKALEVAGRARIPRQKIYEVLDSLIEKGFVRVVKAKAKEFSAVEPQLALESYLARKRENFERELRDRQTLASTVGADLATVFADGARDRGPLDYLRIVTDRGQIAEEYRKLLMQSENEYLEFARAPYAVDPAREPLLEQMLERGMNCRLLFDLRTLSEDEQAALPRLKKAGAEVQIAKELPMKLALFDNDSGMISLDDPVVSHPGLTALVFEHSSLFSAMRSLFNDFWKRGRPL